MLQLSVPDLAYSLGLSFRTVIVDAVRQARTGKLVCDVREVTSGNRLDGVPVLIYGGDDDHFVMFPPVPGTKAIVINILGQPIAVFGVYGSYTSPRIEAEPEDDKDEERELTQPFANDVAVYWGGAKLVFSDSGAVTLSVENSSNPVARIRLPSDGTLRVSIEGEANDAAALAAPTAERLATLESKVNSLISWATALTIDTQTGKPITQFVESTIGAVKAIASKVLKLSEIADE